MMVKLVRWSAYVLCGALVSSVAFGRLLSTALIEANYSVHFPQAIYKMFREVNQESDLSDNGQDLVGFDLYSTDVTPADIVISRTEKSTVTVAVSDYRYLQRQSLSKSQVVYSTENIASCADEFVASYQRTILMVNPEKKALLFTPLGYGYGHQKTSDMPENLSEFAKVHLDVTCVYKREDCNERDREQVAALNEYYLTHDRCVAAFQPECTVLWRGGSE